MKALDLTGHRYGRLTVLRLFGQKVINGDTRRLWLCRCECGKELKITTSRLRAETRACVNCSHRKHGHSAGGKVSPEYKVWQGMWQRCTNPHSTRWRLYGWRGIRVCNRWRSFENFFTDMGPRPSARHSIDRINPWKGYRPSNCKWSDPIQQRHSRRDYVAAHGRVA